MQVCLSSGVSSVSDSLPSLFLCQVAGTIADTSLPNDRGFVLKSDLASNKSILGREDNRVLFAVSSGTQLSRRQKNTRVTYIGILQEETPIG